MQRKNELVSSPIPDYLRSGFPGVHFRGRVLYTHFRRLQVRFYSAQLRGANSSSLPAWPLRREPACCGAMWLSERAEQDARLCEKPASAAAPLRQSEGGSGVSVWQNAWQSRAEQSRACRQVPSVAAAAVRTASPLFAGSLPPSYQQSERKRYVLLV